MEKREERCVEERRRGVWRTGGEACGEEEGEEVCGEEEGGGGELEGEEVGEEEDRKGGGC